MIFDVKELNGGMFATVSGTLDTAAAEKAQQEIQPLIDNADKVITLDLAALEYISSSGLRLLLSVIKATDAKGSKVILKNIPANINKVLTMTGFIELFEVA